MKYLSVCSGVEAASQAWQPLGWEAVAFSEIEPFPCAVLASRFPNVPNLGDMSRIHYDRNTKELYNDTTRIVCRDGIDLLVGGTPCQSFSVAGKRAGLEGASGLAYHYARLIGEIQPRWFVWENVPGALSSVTYGDQRDFNFLLQQFGVGGNADLGVRWNCCWRVLDTQYVRVESFPRAIPQRRRRVFVVGHLATDCGGGCEVLLEPEGVRGNIAPRRVKGQGVAGDFAAGVGGADDALPCALRGNRSASERGKLIESDFTRCAYTVTGVQTDSMAAVSFKGGQSADGGLGVDDGACQTMQSKMSALEPTVAIRTANGVECLTPSADHPQNGSLMVPCTKEVGKTNAVGHENGVAISFIPGNSAKTRSVGASMEANVTLTSMNGESGNKPSVAIAYDGYNQTAHDECTFPLRTANGSEGDDRTVNVAISFKGGQSAAGGLGVDEGACQTMQSKMSAVEPTVAVSFLPTNTAKARSLGEAEEVAPTMARGGGESGNKPSIAIRTANGANGQAVAFKLDSTRANSMKSANPHSGIHQTDVHCALDTTDPNPTKAQGGVVLATPIGDATFRSTSQFGQFKQDDVSGTLDCEHMGGVGNGTPALVAAGGGMHGWRTTNGEDVMPTLTNDLAKMVSNQQQRAGGYLCGPMP